MKNKLTDLNDHLFMEMVDELDLSDADLEFILASIQEHQSECVKRYANGGINDEH